MRFRGVEAYALALLAIMGAAAPAAAQGFLQQLFGFGSPTPAQQTAPQNPMSTPGGRTYTFPGAVSYGSQMSRRPLGEQDDDHDQRATSGYKTICVRMCDGFYFPISNSTLKKGLYRDQMKCRSQCGDEGRLFYLPAKTTEVDSAVDLQGRVYGRMNTAYVYRKALVANCQCKPDPWAESEVERHRQYAEAESNTKPASLPKPDLQIAEANGSAQTDGAEIVVNAAAVTRPKPVVRTALAKPPTKPAHAPRPLFQQASAPAKSITFSGGMGLGGGQLTWPGDAPRRP